MDFKFFERLSRSEARRFLDNFLRVESAGFALLRNEAEKDGVKCDLSLSSIVELLTWLGKNVSSTPRDPDLTLPVWIRETDSYSRGLFDLTKESSIATMRMAYYFGESFVHQFEPLEWGIGNVNFAQQNQPVVTGFRGGMELPVVMVTENLVRGLSSGEPPSVAAKAVETWASFVD